MQEQENIVHIKIIGVGGGGTNAVERMLDANVPMVKYITINTAPLSFFTPYLNFCFRS